MNGHAPEKSADLIVFIHFYVLLGRTDLQKEAILSLLAADCNHGILNGYAPEYARQSFSKRCISFDSDIKPQHTIGLVSTTVVVYLLIPTSNHNEPLC